MTLVAERPVSAPLPSPLPPRPQTDVRRVLVSWVLLGVSLLAAWLALFGLALSARQEAHAQRQEYSQLREALARQTAPLGGAVVPGTPVALLSSGPLDLHDVVVTEGTAAGDLQKGPGHRRDTVLPGQAGVAVVYGRARLFGGPFHAVPHAQPGDRIDVVTGQGRFAYRVDRVRRPGDPLPAPLAAGAARLTLVTAGGVRAGDLWVAGQPVYVDATLTGRAAPSPGVAVALVPRAEQAMRGDPSSLLPLALWLPLLAAAAGAAVWAAARWGFAQAWLVGVPVVLMALWGTSEALSQLLPNLL